MIASNYYEFRNFLLEQIKKEEKSLQIHLSEFSQNIIFNSVHYYHDLLESAYMIRLYSELESYIEQPMDKDYIELYLKTKILCFNFSLSSNDITSINEKIEFRMLKHFRIIITAKLKTLKEY